MGQNLEREAPLVQENPILESEEFTWQWQSNKDPWGNDPERWEKYSKIDTTAIEQAWISGKQIVNIGTYHINFESMLQIHLTDNSKVRRVRRVENNDKRYASSIPKAKSVNEPIGSLVEFLAYIQQSCCSKNPIINEWIVSILKGRPLTIPTYELQILIEDIIDGIINEGKKKNQEARAQELVQELTKLSKQKFLFDQELISVNFGIGKPFHPNEKKEEEDSYRKEIVQAALRIYSEESFVFTSINESLRNSNWGKLEDLREFCVLLTLVLLEQGGHVFTGKVYRGVNLAKELVEYYDPKKTKYFSWYSFISTSKKKECAEKFIYDNSDFVPVIFEIQLNNNIAVDVSKYSKFPEEEEMLLLPGTVYQVIDKRIQNNRVIISLKAVNHSELLKLTENNKAFLEKFENFTFSEEALILDARVTVRGEIYQFDSRNFPLSPEGAIKISNIIKNSYHIVRIQLTSSKIGDAGAEALSNALLSMHVEWLSLKRNEIGDRGAIAIAKAIEQTNLLNIYLTNNLIGPTGAKALAKAVLSRPPFISGYSSKMQRREPVHELSIEYNEIGDQSLPEILPCFGHMRIDSLYLDKIGLTDDGMILLSKLIKDQHHIKTIFLRHNKFSDNGALHFVENLRLAIDLIMGCNMISETGVDKIIERLPSSAIKAIILPGSKTKAVPEVTNLKGDKVYISFDEGVQ